MFGYKDLNIRKIFEGSWNLKFFALTATIGILGIFLISFLVYPQLSQKSEKAEAVIAWEELGGGTNGDVVCMTQIGTDIYVGGVFTQAGGVAANNIAKWDGSSWSALGSGTDGNVLALYSNGSDLYVGGNFTTAGGNAANYIAKWDGGSWSTLGGGLDDRVHTLYHDGTFLYAGGGIIDTAQNQWILKWDGGSWSTLGSGVNHYVYAIHSDGTDIYAGGLFTTAGGNAANRIAKWDGSNWSALGTGVDSTIFVLTYHDTDIYAAGAFTTAGGNAANHIAKWDGSNWSSVGSGMNSNVKALYSANTNLYAGGSFTTAGGNAANRIAKWDGAGWTTFGVGIDDNTVEDIMYDGTDLYAGGSFTSAGGNSANYIAYYGDIPTPPSDPSSLAQKQTNGTTIPSGGTISETSVLYEGDLSDPDGNTVQLCVEKKPVGTAFTNTEDSCGSLVASGSTGSNTISSQPDGSYHWQARAKDSTGLYSSWVEFGSGTNYIISTGGGGDDDIIPGDDDDDNDDDTTPTNQLEVVPPEVTVVPGETSETITIKNLKKLSDENGGTVCLWVPGSQWKNIFVLEKPDGSDSVTGHDALVISGDDVTLKLRGISVGTGQMYISTARGCSACEKNGECETSIGNPVVLNVNVVRGGGGGDDTGGDDDDDDTIGIVDDDPIVGGKITDGKILNKSLLQTLYDILSAPFRAIGVSDSTLSAFFAGAGILFSALGSLAAPISNMLIVPTFISDTIASTWNSILMFFGVKKRKREKQGRVIEAGTDLAVPWATVKILKMEKIGGIYNKRVIATTKTDKQGYFRFIVPPGEYTIIAEKKPYEMYVGKSKKYYSQNTILKIEDYKHGEINVRVAMTIPQGYLKKRLPAFKILGKFEVFFKVTSYVIMILGTIIAIYAVVYNYSTYNLAIIIVYIGLWAFWIISAIALKRSSPWGETIDRSSKEPIDLALVRILDDSGNRVLRTSVTDAMGKYTALLQRSKYQVRASKYGYKLHNPIKVNIKETKGVLSETLLMDKSKEMD